MADLPEFDPRADLRSAAEWVQSLVDAITPQQWGEPTPNSEWTVRELVAHLVGVADSLPATLTSSATAEYDDVPDEGWPKAYATALARLDEAIADPEILTKRYATMFGEQSGGAFLSHFIAEFLVHGWDLATATGQHSEGPSNVAARALVLARKQIPAENRDPKFFAPVVEVSPDAGETRRLAAWLGR
ncbi:MAG: TIGR03086 family protein [Propionibacteriaceae bacterium]|nr:TIGR03086 family protein [Propionibacteriaceae bacterium]